jgi:ligand-binding sensor domain-containing protein
MKRTPIVSVRGVVAVALLLIFSAGAFVIWRASRALGSAAADFHAANDIRFTVRTFNPAANADFEVISAPAVFFQATRFQDHLYIAGPAGLLEYDASGVLLHQYAAGRELPGSPLIALAPAVLADAREPELILATENDGLLAFNGRTFRQIFAYDPEVRAVTAILPDASGHLLIGTKKRGVLVYDGKKITALHSTLKDVYVTALAGSESDLWVGSLDRGVLHFHAAATDNFSEAQGLPDPQVECLAVFEDTTYVGTPLGVAVFSAGRFSRVIAPGVLATALLATRNQLYVGTEDQGVISIPLAGRRPNPNLAPNSGLSEVRQLFLSGEAVFAVARNGLYRMNSHEFGWKQVLQASAAVLSDRNISALAADANGRLWVGYFDRGLDVLARDNARESHVEDEHVFCVNRILLDAKTGTMDVATANGLVRFDGRFGSSGSEQQVLTRANGLIADHVTDVAAYRDGLALATPAGLTFLDASGARSMYAFHGLVNNHVYALGVSGDELVAGTLGGISVLEKGDVAANYTTATSNLKHNWITAVVSVGAVWMVGTYGAGIVGLDRSGHFHAFENASGPFEVNPNAMLVTPSYVLAGTLGKGLYLYDRQSGRWSVIDQGLPSLNVTALAAGGGYIYIGTDNGLVRVREEKLHS